MSKQQVWHKLGLAWLQACQSSVQDNVRHTSRPDNVKHVARFKLDILAATGFEQNTDLVVAMLQHLLRFEVQFGD